MVGPGGQILATAEHRTTIDTDVLDGIHEVRAALNVTTPLTDDLVCSSAGGGLRLAVVGNESLVTAEAGLRVGLSAGAKVVHITTGELSSADVGALREARADLLLLVGGTDGGNATVLEHNATRLARARLSMPIIVAGNRAASDEVGAALASTGRRFTIVDNVLPRIGVINSADARAAIREAFLAHVIGGKGLSRGPTFAQIVRAPTPDAMLRGVEVLSRVLGHDVIVIDVGGATTDVYSVIEPRGEDATIARDVVAPLWHARTVEADLGMRWNALTILEAAARELLEISTMTATYADMVAQSPAYIPRGAEEHRADRELATAAMSIAMRRHGRPTGPLDRPRPLADVGVLVGSGGVLRHTDPESARGALRAVLGDHAGGWRVPAHARVSVDRHYALFAVGLLSATDPLRAASLARGVT